MQKGSYKSLPILLVCILGAILLWAGCEQETQRESGPIVKEEPSKKTLSTMKFDYQHQGRDFSLELPLDSYARQQFKQAPRSYSFTGNKPPAGWKEDYYAMFLGNPDDESAIQALISELREEGKSESEDAFFERVVSFVQGSIEYDWETYHKIDESNMRYPYETLYDQQGVCADKTLLMARLLSELGYDLCYFTFDRANHMALGVRVPGGYGDFRTDYAYIETTNYAPIGRIPNTFYGGIKLGNNATVVKVKGAGKKVFSKIVENKLAEKELEKKYGKEYLFLGPEQRRLKESMTELQLEMDTLKKDLRGCKGTLPQARFEECNRLQEAFNSRAERFNAMVEEFNSLNQQKAPS